MAQGADFSLRPLTVADFPDAVRLYAELSGGQPISRDPAQFVQLLAQPGTTLWGAKRAGRVEAMATLHVMVNMTWSGRPYALVENVITSAKLRGQGLGRAVMQRLIADARQQGAYKIMLLTGKARAAAGFYAALGFDADEKQAMILRCD